MNEQQKTIAQTSITYALLVVTTVAFSLNLGLATFSLSLDSLLIWPHYFFPLLPVFLLVILIMDINKGQRLKTIRMLLNSIFLPSILAVMVIMGCAKLYFVFENHKLDVKEAYLKGQSDAYDESVKQLEEQHQHCIKLLDSAYEFKRKYPSPSLYPPPSVNH